MHFAEYKFSDINFNDDSHYIFQTIKNRKLSDIYHSHDFYEWIFVLEGNCTQIINEEKKELDKNTYCLLCPGDRHKFITQSNDVQLMAISAEADEVDLFKTAFDIKELSYFTTVLNETQIRTLVDLYSSDSEYEYKLILANLLKIYIEAFNKKQTVPIPLKNAVKEMAKIENLSEGIEKFATISGYSKSQLNRLIKKYYNVTLHDFIVNARLETAYNLLLLTKINTEELSEKLGYASFSHFNKIFKNKYGITPAALRKNRGLWTT